MPELPEVESVARLLRPAVTGRTITGVTVAWSRCVATGARRLRRALPGQQVVALGRRGKFLVFALAGGASLLVHLRMTGRLELAPREAPPGRFTRMALELDDGHVLRFEDARKFGRVFLVPRVDDVTGVLGPEPLADYFTPDVFGRLLAGRTRRIKPLLLDQTFLAGLGNIYTDEALNLARLHPLRRADRLEPVEVRRLHRAIRATLLRAIAHNGTSIDWAYPGGTYQERLRVYGRAGRPCRRCHTRIERMVVAQRGTYYCPTCQLREEA